MHNYVCISAFPFGITLQALHTCITVNLTKQIADESAVLTSTILHSHYTAPLCEMNETHTHAQTHRRVYVVNISLSGKQEVAVYHQSYTARPSSQQKGLTASNKSVRFSFVINSE